MSAGSRHRAIGRWGKRPITVAQKDDYGVHTRVGNGQISNAVPVEVSHRDGLRIVARGERTIARWGKRSIAVAEQDCHFTVDEAAHGQVRFAVPVEVSHRYRSGD